MVTARQAKYLSSSPEAPTSVSRAGSLGAEGSSWEEVDRRCCEGAIIIIIIIIIILIQLDISRNFIVVFHV